MFRYIAIIIVLGALMPAFAQNELEIELHIKAIDRGAPIPDVRIRVQVGDPTVAQCRTDSSGICIFNSSTAMNFEPSTQYTIIANKPNFLHLRDFVDTSTISENTKIIKEYLLQYAGPCFGHDDIAD